MPRFQTFLRGADAQVDLRSAYLVGVDGVPVRGDVRLEGGMIVCETRTAEALGLSLLWPVEGYGRVQLETTRLPSRPEPYNLHTELARHRLMRISIKREEWGLYDFAGMQEISARVDAARDRFVAAMGRADQPESAARSADEALAMAMLASEDLCRFHAGVFLARRQSAGAFQRSFLGVTIPPGVPESQLGRAQWPTFDFVLAPIVWRNVQRGEKQFDHAALDAAVQRYSAAGLAIRGGPLLNFGVQFVPDWMIRWESDYEAIAAFSRDHVQRTVQRYGGKIQSWIVASGLHADSAFSFNFEQIMDLTRAAVNTARQAAPRSQIILDLVQPWGEYFARNQRSIPPALYAEMAVQSGIHFDAFGVQFLFGIDSEGYHVRDFLQVSALIDRLANLGKPVHVTAVAVPSSPQSGGSWRGPWSETVQADWLEAFAGIALSKPFVESICFCGLTDAMCESVPSSGLLRSDGSPKPAFERIAALRKSLVNGTTA